MKAKFISSVLPSSLLFVVSLFLLGGVSFGYPAYPQWWIDRGVVDGNAPKNDYAMVNQGQLKNIAVQAVAEMDARLPGGAGTTLHTLVSSWSTPGSSTADYAAATLGQVKNLAKPFYDRLIAAGLATGYPWTGNGSAKDFACANVGQVKLLFDFLN